jgi:hypothetical protein
MCATRFFFTKGGFPRLDHAHAISLMSTGMECMGLKEVMTVTSTPPLDQDGSMFQAVVVIIGVGRIR